MEFVEREIEELIRLGVINLDKPKGPTSHQVSSWVKDIFGCKKVGHGGTLDPNVTGVLPTGIEDGTKALRCLLYAEKEYVGIMKLHKNVDIEAVKNIFKEFTGEIYQIPPVRAAVKRELRKRRIYSLELLEMDKKDVLFKVCCEAGTYARMLCHDIGEALGTGAHLFELRRIRTGNFREENAVTLHQLKDAYVFWRENGDEKPLRKLLLPIEFLLANVPKIVVKDATVDALCHGANLAIPGIVSFDKNIKKDSMVSIFTQKGEGICLGRALLSSDMMLKMDKGIAVDVERVIMRAGTYPKGWKRAST